MIRHEGKHAVVSGLVSMSEAGTLLEEGRALIAQGIVKFDLSGVTTADSSALAVVFGWLREAKRRQCTLEFFNMPASLSSLAEVYGVSDLLNWR
jgi:phospholipid transport system transporter-binding protein